MESEKEVGNNESVPSDWLEIEEEGLLDMLPPLDAGVSNNNNNNRKQQQLYTKSQWRKKRYLIMQDVVDLIDRKDRRAVLRAEEMVGRMLRLVQSRREECNEVSASDDQDQKSVLRRAYNTWIHALAQSSLRDIDGAGPLAEDVLREMEESGIPSNLVSYTCVMDAYARDSYQDPRAAKEAERILFTLLAKMEESPPNARTDWTINSITCDTVLKAWARQGTVEGAQRAQQILQNLEQLENEHVQPTQHSYSTVIHAWGTCGGGATAAMKSDELLERMLSFYTHVAKPDTIIFNSAIHAWANSGAPEAGRRAEYWLGRMQEYHDPDNEIHCLPDAVTYNTILSAWSHSGDERAAANAERVLQSMRNKHKANPDEAPPPDTVGFNTVLHAWSSSPLPMATQRAEAVLNYMIQSQNPPPDIYSFTSVLNALAKCKEQDKVERARQLLDSMIQISKRRLKRNSSSHIKLNQIPFNTVLNACAYPSKGVPRKKHKEILQVAVQTFKEMRGISKFTQPDTVSYGNMIKCCTNLMAEGPMRNKLSLQIFRQCQSEGLVGVLVWNEIQKAVEPSQELWRELGLDPYSIARNRKGGSSNKQQLVELRDLPYSWRQNVNRQDRLAKNRRQSVAQERNPILKPKQAKPPVRRRTTISEPSYSSGKDI